jgi:hypothetical protein
MPQNDDVFIGFLSGTLIGLLITWYLFDSFNVVVKYSPPTDFTGISHVGSNGKFYQYKD